MKKVLILSVLICSLNISANAQKKDFAWNKNQVIAHRGAWKTEQLPENSIASLKHAVELGCYGSEFDVQITSDGVMVVNHNADFLGKDIATSTYKELLAYKKLSNGEPIPTLKDYLKAGKKQKTTKLILEIKIQKTPALDSVLTQKVIAMVQEMKASPWVEYISFGANICKQLIAQVPGASRVSYLNGNLSPEELKAQGYFGLDYHYGVFKKNTDWIEKSHALGLAVNVWTVNKADDMDYFLARKVDFITTNEPELLLQKLK
jgi:glycerophosphoryl diester phosphodiesterase